MTRWAIRGVVGLLFALWSAVAIAADAKADLEKAEQQYANLNYEEANKLAASVVKQKSLSHDVLVRAYRILAISHAVLDREEPARDAFVMLLTYEPDYQADPNLGPRVTTPFFEARGFWRGQPVKPGIDATATAKAKEPGQLRVQVRDPSHIVKRAVAGWRWGTSGDFRTKPVTPGDPVNLDLGEPPPGGTRLDYYVQAFDDKESAILEVGNAAAPKTVTVEVPAPTGGGGGGPNKGNEGGKSVFSSPAFWGTAAAVVLIGGGIVLFAATRPKDVATSASFSPALNCGVGRCN